MFVDRGDSASSWRIKKGLHTSSGRSPAMEEDERWSTARAFVGDPEPSSVVVRD
jgi:hypothetical protein